MSELYNDPPDGFEDIMPPREPVPPPDQTEVNQPGTVWPAPPQDAPALVQQAAREWLELTGQSVETQPTPPQPGETPVTNRYIEMIQGGEFRAPEANQMIDARSIDESLQQASQLRAAQEKPKPWIDVLLPKDITTMLKALPENATYRTMALAVLKIPIPDDCKTYQDISDWVEQQFKPKEGQLPPVGGVKIRVHREEREYGTCRYSDPRSGSAEWTLSIPRLIELAEDSESADDLLNAVQEDACDNVGDIETTSDGDMDHDDYNSTGVELGGESINRNAAYCEIVAALKIHAPHLLEQLEMIE